MAGGVTGWAAARKSTGGGVLRSALLQRALAEFHHCTGLPAKLIPARLPLHAIRYGERENDFCRAMLEAGVCRQLCYRTQTRLLRRVENKLKPQQLRCLGGMVHLAVPVVVRGRHVATILGGRVRLSPAQSPAAEAVDRLVANRAQAEHAQRLRALYHATPVLMVGKVRAAIRLLDVLARFFEEVLAHQSVAGNGEPPRLL